MKYYIFIDKHIDISIIFGDISTYRLIDIFQTYRHHYTLPKKKTFPDIGVLKFQKNLIFEPLKWRYLPYGFFIKRENLLKARVKNLTLERPILYFFFLTY